MVIAALTGCIVINTMNLDRNEKTVLIGRAAHFLLPMLAMPVVGFWFLMMIPDDSRQWVLGGSIAMTMFLNIAIGASALIAAYALVGIYLQRLYINGATATLLLALAFGASAGGEFVREGVRKPYTIRQTLFSNSITPGKVAYFREHGSVAGDPYPLLNPSRYPNPQVRLGAQVFRFQCSICHTESGVNGLTHLAGSWTLDQRRLNIAQLQQTKSFMPPFAGPASEVEAVVQWLGWLEAGEPVEWPENHDPLMLEQISQWLAEADRLSIHKHTADSL
jgi:hypothetical protein